MVLASHIIMTCYGFWLPNDPRGSWSDLVRNWEIFWFAGPATKTTQRRSLARNPHDRSLREAAKSHLRYDPVIFTGKQALCVAQGFAKAARESQYQILAAAILPSHAHLVVARHERPAERIAGHLKTRATQALVEKGMHPFVQHRGPDGRFPSVWGQHAWKVFLDSIEAIHRAVRYVQDNPLKENKPRQRWSFVQTPAPSANVQIA
jgi:REP element-mobilizing transposase RayT